MGDGQRIALASVVDMCIDCGI